MTTKIKDLTNTQMNKICKNHPDCVNCPLKRTHIRDGKERVYNYCFKSLRALYYANVSWWKEHPQNVQFPNTLEDILQELYDEEAETEQQEIEVNEEDLK